MRSEYQILDFLKERGYVLDYGYKKNVELYEIEIIGKTAVYWTNDMERLEDVINRYGGKKDEKIK